METTQLKKRNIVITAIVVVLLLALVLRQSGIFGTKQKQAEKTFLAMDTIMSVTVYGTDPEAACEAAISEVNRLDELLSTGNSESEVSRLNQNGGGSLSDDTATLFDVAISLHEKTGGVFDITIYPVMRAWGFTDGNYRVPTEEELENLLGHVDASAVEFDAKNNNVVLPEGVEIDFGGIAKGYTSARLVALLEESGITSACINLGGNVQVLGAKPDGSAWRIAVQDPTDGDAYLGTISVKDGQAVITSGGYERYFEENGQTYHHIIDPRTGYPAQNGFASVTIVSTDATLADGLSTALFVLGTEGATAYYRAHADEFDCILYTTDGEIYVSEGIAGAFESERKYTIIES